MRGEGRPIVGKIDRPFVDEVEVEFAGADVSLADGFDVGGEVAGVAEAGGDGVDADGEAKVIIAVGAHVMCVGGGLVHAGEKGGAAGGTGGVGAEHARV